jgi:hypothetical protein
MDTENSSTISLSKNGPEWQSTKPTDTRTAVAFPLRAPTKIRSWNKPTNGLTYKVLEIATICDIYIAELEEPNGETRVMTDWDAQNFPVGTFARATCDSKNMTWKFKVVPRESVNRNIEYYNTFYYNYP